MGPLNRLEHEHVLWTFAVPRAGLAHLRADLAHARSRSRVTSRAGLKFLIEDEDGRPTNETRNIVYKEIVDWL